MCGARLSYILLLSPCEVRSEPDPAVSSGWVPVLFVESQTQLPSSAESLSCVECERDSVLLLSPAVLHRLEGRLSKSLLSLWRRLSHPSTKFPCVVHTVYSLTQGCPLSHTVVATAQQILAELVEGDREQRLSKPMLSWWKESVPGERESDSATLAES